MSKNREMFVHFTSNVVRVVMFRQLWMRKAEYFDFLFEGDEPYLQDETQNRQQQ